MGNVSRPLLGVLVATVAFFALWVVALKPGASTSPGGSKGLGQYQSAIDKAHAAVKVADAASVVRGGTVSAAPSSTASAAKPSTVTPATTATTATTATPVTPVTPAVGAKPATATSKPHASAKPTAKPVTGATTASRVRTVMHALRSGKVLALLFYNGAAADDRAVKRELAAVPERGRRVVKLAIPVSELASYTVVTNQVQVSISPTLVIIDRRHQAVTVTGYADRFEIAQRVADALAAK